jgi:hypothetical protein
MAWFAKRLLRSHHRKKFRTTDNPRAMEVRFNPSSMRFASHARNSAGRSDARLSDVSTPP